MVERRLSAAQNPNLTSYITRRDPPAKRVRASWGVLTVRYRLVESVMRTLLPVSRLEYSALQHQFAVTIVVFARLIPEELFVSRQPLFHNDRNAKSRRHVGGRRI